MWGDTKFSKFLGEDLNENLRKNGKSTKFNKYISESTVATQTYEQTLVKGNENMIKKLLKRIRDSSRTPAQPAQRTLHSLRKRL